MGRCLGRHTWIAKSSDLSKSWERKIPQRDGLSKEGEAAVADASITAFIEQPADVAVGQYIRKLASTAATVSILPVDGPSSSLGEECSGISASESSCRADFIAHPQ
jgi:hypothetical protein